MQTFWNISGEEMDEYRNFGDVLKFMQTLEDNEEKIIYVIRDMINCCESDRRFIGFMLLDYLRSCDKHEIKSLERNWEKENN